MYPTAVLTPSSSSSAQEKFPVREWTFTVPGLQDHVSFNPLVSGIGISVLWGLAIWSMVDPAGSNSLLVDWRASVTLYFTWLFIGCRAVFFFFIVFIGVKFSHVKLGHKDEPPEFSTAAFFSMIFA
jgi:choline-glycine betaine transporter